MLAAMDFNMWYMITSLLLVSAGASRYDQGPQRFYDVSSEYQTAPQNENREVVVYLTLDQVRALEAGGAVVRSDEEPENEADSELPAEPQVNEDQEEASEEDENENIQEEEEVQQQEQETPENTENQDLDFEEILRILNDEQADEQQEAEEAVEEPAQNEPQVKEENTESPRNFSPRITLGQQQQQQQEEKYLAPAVAKKEQILKSYSLIRYQPNQQRQRINIQLLQQQAEVAASAEESSEEPQTEAPTQEKKKYKLIPYEVVETPAQQEPAEEPAQQEANVEDDGAIDRRIKLQNILKELKAAAKYNDQKYAIELEKILNNAVKQNAASQAETISKMAPILINRQLNKKLRVNKIKPGKGTRDAESQQAKSQQTKYQKSALRPIPVPVMKAEKPGVQKSIAVPVETSKRLSVKNVYVKSDKPVIISRRVPENKKQNPTEVPSSRPERITILRHINWDQ